LKQLNQISFVTAIVYGLTTTLSANTQSIGDSNEQ